MTTMAPSLPLARLHLQKSIPRACCSPHSRDSCILARRGVTPPATRRSGGRRSKKAIAPGLHAALAGEYMSRCVRTAVAEEQQASVATTSSTLQELAGELKSAGIGDPDGVASERLERFCRSTEGALPSMGTDDLVNALTSVSRLHDEPSDKWLHTALQRARQLCASFSGSQLADVLWAAADLGAARHHDAASGGCDALEAEIRTRAEDIMAHDLCRIVCAAGSLKRETSSNVSSAEAHLEGGNDRSSSQGQNEADSESGSPHAQWTADTVAVLMREAQYQLKEFPGDFTAVDIARLISGLADLGAPVTDDFRAVLMRVVYGALRTIQDKAAVDFALAKLATGDRSIHYDPRWNHEELRWLPGHERDKRRILKHGWYRTKWTGWRGD